MNSIYDLHAATMLHSIARPTKFALLHSCALSALALLFSFSASLAPVVHANGGGITYTVNTTAADDDGSCDALASGTGNKDCTLHEVINAALDDNRPRLCCGMPPASLNLASLVTGFFNCAKREYNPHDFYNLTTIRIK